MDIYSIKKAYKRYSSFYNYLFGKIFNEGRMKATDIVNSTTPSESKILEVGVGTGLSLPLYHSNLEITGIDVSREMLQKAKQLCQKKKLLNVKQLLEMDVEALEFPDQTFDKVVAMYVASVVPNLDKFIDEITRVCKTEGHIIIVNHFSSKNPLINIFETKLSVAHKWFGFNSHFPIEPLLAHPKLKLICRCKVNLFGYWQLLYFKNNAYPIRNRMDGPLSRE